jgi:DNA-binding MarR family transcriptional regulator
MAGPSRSDALAELGTELSAMLAAARAFAAETAVLFDPPLSSAAFQIVQWLHGAGPMRSMQIADGLAMDRSALSRVLKQLAPAGLVDAHVDPQDGRATVYMLTEVARARMNDALALKGMRYEQRLAAWSNADICQLTELLRRLNGARGTSENT